MARIALALAAGALAAGCGAQDEPASPPAERPAERPERERERERPSVERARCPAQADNCAAATGTVVYVERVDPDGDGDAHFVLLSKPGVTAPGITVVDVRADLRPRPLPRPGDLVSAAGPVYPGSFGQRQIEAETVNVSVAPG